MRGLYLNCDLAKIPASEELSAQYSVSYQFETNQSKGLIIYNEYEWPEQPTFELDDHLFVISGWFIFNNVRNDLKALAQALVQQGKTALEHIQSGVFVLFWSNDNQECVITDPIGLSTHFRDLKHPLLKIAPSVEAIYRKEEHPTNSLLENIFNKKQHLFGNFTIYDGVERLTPHSVTTSNSIDKYKILNSDICVPLEDLANEFARFINSWPQQDRLLPLSSGLDSRLILASGQFNYGFTYGPTNSPEITIARKFCSEFNHYYAYDYSAPELHPKEEEIVAEMSFGSLKPIHRLLTNYEHVKSHFPKAHVFFDGYCGDVFQRGTFLTFKGVEGELLKLFPWLYKLLNWNSKKLLQKRNKALSETEFEMVYNDFLDKTEHLALNDYQKVTYYEFLYGRGGRYAVFGSNILAAQFFTIASPFADNKIFNTVIHQDFSDSVRYGSMRKIWKKVADRYRSAKVESGYTPKSSIWLIPFIQLAYRIMFHLIPSRANYGIQQQRLLKKQSKTKSL